MPFYLTRLLLVVKWYKDSVFQNSFALHVGASLSKMWNSRSSYTSALQLWGPVGLDCTVWECALLLLNMEISSCRLIKSKAHICCLFVAALLTTRYSINGCCFFVVVAQTGEYRFGIPLLYYIKMHIRTNTEALSISASADAPPMKCQWDRFLIGECKKFPGSHLTRLSQI